VKEQKEPKAFTKPNHLQAFDDFGKSLPDFKIVAVF
jgi:hypothetical protein